MSDFHDSRFGGGAESAESAAGAVRAAEQIVRADGECGLPLLVARKAQRLIVSSGGSAVATFER